ncbi:hypothetical protein, partial [Aminobacterium mobile]|uniref:hypothetical protein n=1 Tax=Aminobacterium mobile TaxID=81467 RepID=UPI002FDAD6E7
MKDAVTNFKTYYYLFKKSKQYINFYLLNVKDFRMAAILLALSGSFFALYINSRMKAMNTPTKRPSIAARVTMRDRLG